MKKIIGNISLLAIIVLGFTGCASGAENAIVKTGGSTSVEKVMNTIIYQFQAENPETSIGYEQNGSGDGIKNTISGLYEIGHSSRELKTDGSEDGLDAIPYAIDGIAIIVNKENKISDLTNEQLQNIYTGKIKNWKEIGGADSLITVVTREVGSGTRSAFAEIVGLEKDDKSQILKNATVQNSTGAVQTTVSTNTNAIGYLSFSDIDLGKVTPIKYENVAITEATLADNTYKLKREFYLLTKKDAQLSDGAKNFIAYILSLEGQNIVAEKGLLQVG